MALQRTSVGVDLGTHSIKVVQLKVSEKGAFIQNALYFDRATLAARGVDIEDRVAVAALLKSQMVEHRIQTSGVVVGIPGNDSILRYTSIPPVPAWRLKVIMGYEVGEVAERVGENLASDYRVLPIPRELDEDQIILVGLSKEDPLAAMLSDLGSAGIFVEKCIPAPLALSCAHDAFGDHADSDDPDDDLLAVVEIGRSNLNCLLVLNDNLVFARSVSFGGDQFTEAVARDLGLDEARAERIKIEKGSVKIRRGGDDPVVDALRGCAAQIQGLIQSSVRFCRSQTGVKLGAPSRLVLLGGGARLRGLDEYLRNALRKPVKMFKPRRVTAVGNLPGAAAEVYATSPGEFAQSLGLAVAGVRESSLALNIVPERYRERRRFRERTVFLYAAGVLLLLTLLLGTIDAWLQRSAAKGKEAELRDTLAFLDRSRAEMEENAERNGQVRERINRILRESEVGSFQSYVIDLLRKTLPPEIRFTRVKLLAELDENDEDILYDFVFEGAADDSNYEASRLIRELKDRLESESRIAAALVTIQDAGVRAGKYEFRLVVLPRFESYRG